MTTSTTPRELAAMVDIESVSEIIRTSDCESSQAMELKNAHIYDCFSCYNHLKLIFDKNYTHQGILDRFASETSELSLIVSTSVITHAIGQLNDQKNVIITDDDNIHDYYIDCSKKTFGNWKVMIKSSLPEVMEIGYIIMMHQLKKFDYITIELAKNKYYKLCELNILHYHDITLIPSGYVGYLVNIQITQENIHNLINELIIINSTTFKITNYPRQSILTSISDLELPIHNPIKLLKSTPSITKLLHLNKAEVGFLIGKNGDRINLIRNKTGCKVTIMPVSPGDNILTGNKRTPQVIKLFGTTDKVDNAYQLIMVNLQIFKENGSTFM